MRQKLQINIPEPCHENWNNMTETQQGRFCMACQKEVVDFSLMSDKEILQHISNASKSICGRVVDTQLQRDIVMPREPKKIWWRHWVSVAASFTLLISKANSQVKTQTNNFTKGKVKNVKIETPPLMMGAVAVVMPGNKPSTQIHGRVVDEKGDAVPFATVKLVNTSIGVSADATGYFTMNVKQDVTDLQLRVSSIGLAAKIVEINDFEKVEATSRDKNTIQIETDNIVLTTNTMDEVVVTANTTTGMILAGGISYCRKPTRYQKAKDTFKEAVGINEVKVYPNPIAVNSVFNISFHVKEVGDYNV